MPLIETLYVVETLYAICNIWTLRMNGPSVGCMLACLSRRPGRMIPPDDQQLLARRGVPAWRIVVHAAVANIKTIYDGIPKRSAALDDSPAHDDDISIVRPRSRPSPLRRYDGWTIGPLRRSPDR